MNDTILKKVTSFVQAALSPLILITPSGIEHPYYSYAPSTFKTDEEMFVRITSFPALGHEYIVPHKQHNTTFNVLIESEVTQPSLEVQIWHNHCPASTWEAKSLNLSSSPKLSIVQSQSKLVRTWFDGTFPSKPQHNSPVSFTIRFRTSPSDSWKWAHDQSGVDDGRLLYQPPLKVISQRKSLAEYVEGMSDDVKVENVPSETPDTILWSLTAAANGAKGEDSGFTSHRFGLPRDYTRWFALVRLWSPWLAPRQGRGSTLAEKDGVLYSFMRKDGLHVVLLAMSGIDDVMTLLQAKDGKLNIHARNDREEEGVARVLVAVAATAEEGIAAVMYHARRVMSEHNIMTAEEEEVVKKIRELESVRNEEKNGVKANWVQDWSDGFTFCTWNSLGQNLTEEKISGALKSLEDNGIRITNLIIDDNWQSLDHEGENQMIRGWSDFVANPEGFPEGLNAAVSKIRKKYPDIKHIGVWHALLGYWGGISPEGRLARDYKTREVLKNQKVIAKGSSTMLVIDEPDVKRMYDDFYTFLNSSGVDSVKTDAQFMLDEIVNASARRDLTNTYLNTWISAQLRHFGGLAISCMSQTPAILFRCQLPNNLPACPTRNSDDFFPDVDESHPWHIFCNAHNSIFTKHLNVLPDWDMFQTSHPWASFHAAARCVSGGPIYVTDTPDKHDVNLISQMTAQTIRDQTVILRPSVVGRSTQCYIGFEEERLVKVGAFDGRSGSGTSFMGFFNCRNEGVTEVVGVAEFMGAADMTAGVLVRSHRTGACSSVLSAQGETPDVFAVQVDGRGWDVLSATPVFAAVTEQGEVVYAANLGLVGKMTGGAAIVSTAWSTRSAAAGNGKGRNGHFNGNGHSHHTSESNGDTTVCSIETRNASRSSLNIKTSLKALGTWGLWVSTNNLDIERDTFITIQGRAVPIECVSVKNGKGEEGKGHGGGGLVIEVDLVRAWKEMDLKPGWGNEVGLEGRVWF